MYLGWELYVIEVPQDAVNALHNTTPVACDEAMQWVDLSFEKAARGAYLSIGSSSLQYEYRLVYFQCYSSSNYFVENWILTNNVFATFGIIFCKGFMYFYF